MKSRLCDDTTIAAAERAVQLTSTHVQCVFGDSEFTTCVPRANRKQLMHEVFVSGVTWAVFIVSKIVNGVSSIIQTVIIEYPEDSIQQYADVIVPRARTLIGWMHAPAVTERGYLFTGHFPNWVVSSQRKLLTSRYKLIAAFRKRSNLTPVRNVKSSFIYRYNHGKWGLDKWSEAAISVLPTGVPMEVKYIFCLLAGPLVNLWRVEQGTNIIRPFANNYRSKHGPGSYPSLEQLRRQLWAMKWDDFIYKFTCQVLGDLQKMGRDALLANYSPTSQRLIRSLRQSNCDESREKGVSETDTSIQSVIETQSKWPPQRERVRNFNKEELTRVRLYSSKTFMHTVSSGKKRKCTLCHVSRNVSRNTSYECKVCKVPLCIKPHVGMLDSCFVMWHTHENLEEARAAQREALLGQREASKDDPRFEHARNVRARLMSEHQVLGMGDNEVDDWEIDPEDGETGGDEGRGMDSQDLTEARSVGDGAGDEQQILSDSSSSDSEDTTEARWRKFKSETLTLKQLRRKIRREWANWYTPDPDECAPGEKLSDEKFREEVEAIERAVTESAMGPQGWLRLRARLGACRVDRGHARYARWSLSARTVIRRKAESDGEEGSGEEEGSGQAHEPRGKTSGMEPEDYDEQMDSEASIMV